MEVYIKHVFYWMIGYKPCRLIPCQKQGNKKGKLNKPADENRTHYTLRARMWAFKMFKHKIFSFLLQNYIIY